MHNRYMIIKGKDFVAKIWRKIDLQPELSPTRGIFHQKKNPVTVVGSGEHAPDGKQLVS